LENVLDKLSRLPLDHRDNSLGKNLIIGTIKARATLDHIIGHFSNIPLERIRKDVLILLRIALYQLLFLERVPGYASVSWTVSMVKSITNARVAGFANAVLRNIIRNLEGRGDLETPPSPSVCYGPSSSARFTEKVFPSPDANPAKYFSAAFSYPLRIVQKWLNEYSRDEVLSILKSGNAVRPIFFWINKPKADEARLLEELRSKAVAFTEADSSGLYRAEASILPALARYLDSGKIYIQDKTAYEICRHALKYLGKLNLDICAGVGGKALALSVLSARSPRFIAAEPEKTRFAMLRENVERMCCGKIETLNCDAYSLPAKFKGRFDFIIADVPCSNSGVLGRRAEARWRMNVQSLRSLCALQKKIVSRSLDYLKPSGYLVYSTCSIEKEENSEIVLYLCRHFSDIRRIEEKLFMPRPSPQEGDGGYVAVMQKRSWRPE